MLESGEMWGGSQRGGGTFAAALRATCSESPVAAFLRCGIHICLHPHLRSRIGTRKPLTELHTRVNGHPHSCAHTRLEELETPDLVFISLQRHSVTSPISSYFLLLKGVKFLEMSSGCAVMYSAALRSLCNLVTLCCCPISLLGSICFVFLLLGDLLTVHSLVQLSEIS